LARPALGVLGRLGVGSAAGSVGTAATASTTTAAGATTATAAGATSVAFLPVVVGVVTVVSLGAASYKAYEMHRSNRLFPQGIIVQVPSLVAKVGQGLAEVVGIEHGNVVVRTHDGSLHAASHDGVHVIRNDTETTMSASIAAQHARCSDGSLPQLGRSLGDMIAAAKDRCRIVAASASAPSPFNIFWATCHVENAVLEENHTSVSLQCSPNSLERPADVPSSQRLHRIALGKRAATSASSPDTCNTARSHSANCDAATDTAFLRASPRSNIRRW
jgi:hypothetical protein